MKLEDIKAGDTVTRMLGGTVPMELKVDKIDDEHIYCGPWKFSRKTGAEIDDELGWDESTTGSYLKTTDPVTKTMIDDFNKATKPDEE